MCKELVQLWLEIEEEAERRKSGVHEAPREMTLQRAAGGELKEFFT